MSAEAITDALARHFAENVAGIKAAYSSGATATTNVKTLPNAIPDTPIAVVYWQRYRLESTGFEKVRHFIDADLYFSDADTASSYKTYLPFVSKTIISMRSNSTLYQTCVMAEAVSAGPPIQETISSQAYVRLTFQFEAIEATATTYT